MDPEEIKKMDEVSGLSSQDISGMDKVLSGEGGQQNQQGGNLTLGTILNNVMGPFSPIDVLGRSTPQANKLASQLETKHPDFGGKGLFGQVGDVIGDTVSNAGKEVGDTLSGLFSLPKVLQAAGSDQSAQTHPIAGLFGPLGAIAANPTLQNLLGGLVSGTANNLKEFGEDPTGSFYNKPINSSLNTYQMFNLFSKLLGPEVASEISPVSDEATSNTRAIPSVRDVNSDLGLKGRMARDVVSPDSSSSSIGTLSKEENISKNVLDSTSARTPYGVEKQIEKLYPQVNEKLSSVVNSHAEKSPSLLLTAPSNGDVVKPGLLDELVSSVSEDPAAQINPSLLNRAKSYFQKYLESKASADTTVPGELYTNAQLMDRARKAINGNLQRWIESGKPMVTEADQYNSILHQMNYKLLEMIGETVPEARELVNVQANLIPAYEGILGKLAPKSAALPINRFGLITRIANPVIDATKIGIARNPNSEFALRLKELLGEPMAENIINQVPAASTNAPNLTWPWLMSLLSQGDNQQNNQQ